MSVARRATTRCRRLPGVLLAVRLLVRTAVGEDARPAARFFVCAGVAYQPGTDQASSPWVFGKTFKTAAASVSAKQIS